MWGIDTDVLVRLVVTDDEAQQATARRRVEAALESGLRVFVTTVVIAELAWVLDSVYGYDRHAIADVVAALGDTPPFELESRSAVLAATVRLRGGDADLSDYVVLAVCADKGASPVFTFDRALAAEPGAELP